MHSIANVMLTWTRLLTYFEVIYLLTVLALINRVLLGKKTEVRGE